MSHVEKMAYSLTSRNYFTLWFSRNNRLFKFLSNSLDLTLLANNPAQFPNLVPVSISQFSRSWFLAHFPVSSHYLFSLEQFLITNSPKSPQSWIPWNLSFRYIYCSGQFTPKMKANAEPRLLSSLVWIDSGVVVSQHRLKSIFMKWNVTEWQVSWNSSSEHNVQVQWIAFKSCSQRKLKIFA